MSNVLSNRGDCLREIRRLVGEDPWTTRRALLVALQLLDLAGVNQVLEDLESVADGPLLRPEGLLAKLLEERWG